MNERRSPQKVYVYVDGEVRVNLQRGKTGKFSIML